MTVTALRPAWDEHWMEIARKASRRSLCSRSQVGAVIVDRHNQQISMAYNGPPAGFDHRDQPCVVWCARSQCVEEGRPTDPGYTDCPTIHAEANALLMVSKRRMRKGTIYTTKHPCFTCATNIANSRLVRVVVEPQMSEIRDTSATGYALMRAVGLTVDVW